MCILISEKRVNSIKKCLIFAGPSMKKLKLSGERAENAIFQNGQIHENREVERGGSVELVSSTPCPPI